MNIYEQIKNSVTNKEVEIHYLGQPVRKSANYLLYSSHFRKDKNPSFAVNDKGFIDFGDKEHCGDMIQFIKQLKGCQYQHEAAKIIVEDLGLNITIPENIKSVKKKKSKKKFSELCFEKGNKSNNIIYMFDSQKYNSKPAKEQIGYIKNRISKKKLEIEQIEYQDISEPEKMSHNVIANQLLEENEIRVYENTLYIYENGVYKKNEKSIHRKIIEIYPKSAISMQKEVISYL